MSRTPRTLTMLAAALLASAGALAAETAVVSPDPPKATSTKATKTALECEDTTSSRIRRDKAGKCTKSASSARSYSREEIERTGQTDVSEALRRLDPRFH